MTEATSTPVQEVPTAVTLGALLRQAREQKGYSLGEVAERLKLSAKQVEALEQGFYQSLPEPVFVKGFLCSYARLLDVNETKIQEYIQAIFPKETAQTALATPTNGTKSPLDYRDMPVQKPFPRWVFGVVILAAMGAAIYAWQSKSSAENQRQTESTGQSVINPASMPSVDADNVSIIPMTPANMASGNVNNVATAAAAASTPNVANVGEQTLMISVRYRSLLHVVNHQGEVLVNQIVPAGSEHRFDSKGPYQVRIGYASGAQVSLGGVDIPLQDHIRNKTATLTVGSNNE